MVLTLGKGYIKSVFSSLEYGPDNVTEYDISFSIVISYFARYANGLNPDLFHLEAV